MNDAATAVGVAGDDADAIAKRLARDGLAVRVDRPADLAANPPDLIVAVGESAITAIVAAEPAVPIVPVDAGAGIRAVPSEDVSELGPSLAVGDWNLERHRPYAVAVNGRVTGTAVFDVTLMTAEAARISEYTVVADGERLDNARADGVVLATPAGSTDYARRVEAPVLAPETGIAVAWIAPFRSDPDRWVVPPSSLSLSVERDEAAVDLLVDGAVAATIGPDDEVEVSPCDPFAVATVACSRRRYE